MSFKSIQSIAGNRSYLIGIILGALGSAATLAAHSFGAALPLYPGDFFLFLAAGSLGIPATAAAGVVTLSYDFMLGADLYHSLRVIGLALAWAVLRSKGSRFAGFPLFAIIWVVGVLPASWWAQSYPMHSISFESLPRTLASDLICASLAALMLQNGAVWHWLTGKSPHYSLSVLIVNTLALTAVVSTSFSTLVSSATHAPLSFSPHVGPAALAGMVLLCVGFPWWTSTLLCRKLSDVEHKPQQSSLLKSPQQQAFSGLSSAFWRQRNSSDNISIPSSRTMDSDTRLMIARSGASSSDPERAICAVDGLGTITFANRRFRRLFGIVDQEIAGRTLHAIQMNPAARDALLRHLETARVAGPHTSEVKLNQLPENLRFFELSSQRVEDVEGSTLGSHGDIIISARDITHKRAIETQLLQSQRLASLGNFISGIGHTFNNALMKIIGKTSAARRASDVTIRDLALQEVVDTAWKAADQVKKLVEFAEGPPSLAKDCDINQILSEHQTLLQGMIGSRCPLTITTTGSLGVHCDPNLILQAITNLALNSRDAYEGKGGAIEIDLAREEISEHASAVHIGARPGTFVRLRVRDQGVGMTPDLLAHAFEPLFTTRKSAGHSGLGLSTVYAIVRAHDGFLTAESHPQRGTSISLYFPEAELSTHASPSPEVDTAFVETAPSQKAKILVVEDESAIREMVVKMLGALGYEVSGCGNGAEALDRCTTGTFDLLLVDVAMPQMAGPELIERLKQMKHSTRAIFMTGYGQNAVPSEPIPCLPKPFDMETLAQTVSAALSNQATPLT